GRSRGDGATVDSLTDQKRSPKNVGAANSRASSRQRRQPTERDDMRFMMLMIPLGYEQAAPGTMPPADAVAAMMKYNEALKAAGVLITLDGLHPPSMGARVSFAGG